MSWFIKLTGNSESSLLRQSYIMCTLHITLFCLSTAFSCDVAAVDVEAGDYAPLPDGSTIGLLYYQHAERNEIYVDGHKQSSAAGLDSDIGILRVVHYMQLGKYIVDPQFLLPFGSMQANGETKSLGSDSGIGDLILAATVWPLNDPVKQRYFGITPFIYLPTGSYERDRVVNLSENRWKFALQAGYATALTDKVSLDLVGDVTLFGKNDDYGSGGVTKKQDALYQGQIFLRYHFTDTFDVRASLSKLWGGESKIDGVSMNDEPDTLRYTVGTSFFVSPSTQLMINFGSDILVDNGFKEDGRISLRLLQLF